MHYLRGKTMGFFDKLKDIVQEEITNQTVTQKINDRISSFSEVINDFNKSDKSPIIDEPERATSDFIAPPKPEDAPDDWSYRMPTPEDKRYTDEFKTDEGLKLREILLFVWWVRTKKPKDYNIDGPIYFSYNYDVDFRKTSQELFELGYMVRTENDKVVKTESGQALFDKYQSLWSIHTSYLNLDTSFSYSENDVSATINDHKYKRELNTLESVLSFFNAQVESFQSEDNFLEVELSDLETSVNDLSTVISNLIKYQNQDK